ncbi:MAG TPA: SgcJ/EcaC family oxidoreductase [Pirellulales bacterium]
MFRNAFHSAGILLLLNTLAVAQESTQADDLRQEDVRQIEAEVAAYVEAFNDKDAAALARHWSKNGVYVRPADGKRLTDRKAIQKEFKAAFVAQPEAVLKVDVRAIRFVTADVAIEEGTAEVTPSPGTVPTRTDYTVVHVQRDGQWQIDSIRETELPSGDEAPDNHLDSLAWLVGEWGNESDDAKAETSVTWTKNKAFLSYSFNVSAGGGDELEGTQIIGYDPAAGQIRSWMFDSDGGFGAGVWTREGNQWTVKFQQILADGRTASSTNVYTHIDDNTLTWASSDREVGGKALPDVAPVKLVRKAVAKP